MKWPLYSLTVMYSGDILVNHCSATGLAGADDLWEMYTSQAGPKFDYIDFGGLDYSNIIANKDPPHMHAQSQDPQEMAAATVNVLVKHLRLPGWL